MKLSDINSHIHELNNQYFKQQDFASSLYMPAMGYDMGARTLGATSYPMGIPTNPRHSKFMGLTNRIAITL